MESKRSKEITFTLVGHAHLDPVWLWDWREGYETVKATFRSALDRIRENPDLVFVHSSAAHYHWMEDHPQLLQKVREAVDRGQWEPVGGWWVEPDVNLPSGEALARQALYGQRYFQQVLGRRARVAFLPDSFGHPPTLPQLFRQAGLEYFVFMRPGAGEMELPSNLFLWEGPDGSRILTARVECYNTNPRFITSSLERNLAWRPRQLREWLHLFGVGNHGGGPTRQVIASIRELAKDPEWPTLRLGSLEGFFDRAAAGGREHPVVARELQHHARGCYSAHTRIKQLNRTAENGLLTAESFAVLASFYGLPYPRESLTHGWRQLLFNQFHDILAGSSVASAYQDAEAQLGEAIAIAERTRYRALQTLAQRIDTRRAGRVPEEVIRFTRWSWENWTADLGDGVPVILFNPSPWPRREVVEVEVNDWGSPELRVLNHRDEPVPHQWTRTEPVAGSRRRVLFSAQVPALGYSLYRLVDEPSDPLPQGAPLLEVTHSVLENGWWRLELDPATGALRALHDKTRQLQLLAGAGAQLVVVDDPSDTWGHGVVNLRSELGPFLPTRVEVLESGPVRATWRITYAWGGSTARQEISLYRESPAIRGRLTIDWHEQQKALKIVFPLALDQARATFSVPYGHTERPAAGEEEPLQLWLDVTGTVRDARGGPHPAGVALINDGAYAGDALGGDMRLTLLRSPVFAHHDPARPDPGQLYAYQDQGIRTLRWQLIPHSGSWADAGVIEAARDLNNPMPFVREYVHAGDLAPEASLVSITPPNRLDLGALKQAEEGEDLILRLYEPLGRPARATVTIPLAGASFPVELGAHQIKSYRISRGGSVQEVNLLEE